MPSIKQEIKRKVDKSNKLKDKTPQFKSTHELDFMWAPHWDKNFVQFKIGTCHGLYTSSASAYQILAISNDNPGNGHLQDVFDWFENSCKRDKKDLMFLELMNFRFKKYLIEKRGFINHGKDSLIKSLDKIVSNNSVI